MTPIPGFAPRGDDDAVETGTVLSPKFDAHGLITAIAVDAATDQPLMVAHMNREALVRTIASGDAWFWSRSRQVLWQKGETSGNRFAVKEIRVDCDQDAILLRVTVAGDGVACHRGYRSCFYRTVPIGELPTPELALVLDEEMPRVVARKSRRRRPRKWAESRRSRYTRASLRPRARSPRSGP